MGQRSVYLWTLLSLSAFVYIALYQQLSDSVTRETSLIATLLYEKGLIGRTAATTIELPLPPSSDSIISHTSSVHPIGTPTAKASLTAITLLNEPSNISNITTIHYNASEMEQIFEQRRQVLGQTCKRRFNTLGKNRHIERQWVAFSLTKKHDVQSAFFIDEENKSVFCLIAKVASTSWKRFLLYISENSHFSSPESIPHDYVHSTWKWPTSFSLKPVNYYQNQTAKLLDMLASYKKVIWVRHPMLRLVSAWNSKLTGTNDFYGNTIGRRIIQRFRENKPKHFNVTALKNTSVSLEEFFKYLEAEVKTYRINDVHWAHYNTQCMPCYLQYDYIGHLGEDAETYYVLDKISKNNSFWQKANETQREAAVSVLLGAKNKRSDAVWLQMLKQIPKKLLDALYNIYRIDFDIFGFEKVKP